MSEVKATTVMLISRLEQQIEKAKSRGNYYCTVGFTASEVAALIGAIRELESELKKKHAKPSYSAIGKPRYYCAE